MSKTITAGMDTHLDQEVTSLATCWRITRTDGIEFFFTDHDADIIFEGNTYEASSGYQRTAIQNDSTLSVDNLDIEGIFDSEAIKETEIRVGLFDFAEVRIFVVNWQNITDSDIKIKRGRFGEVILTDRGIFKAELRGMTQDLSQRIVEIYQPECRVDLGDTKCKVPIDPVVRTNNTAFILGNFIRVNTLSPIVSEVRFLVPADSNANGVGFFPTIATIGPQAFIQTVTIKFGTGALEFTPSGSIDPSDAFVSYPDSNNFNLGGSDFAIEGFVQFKNLTSTFQVFASHYLNTGDERSWFLQRNGNNFEAFFSDDGTSTAPAFTLSGAFTWVINTWYHVAVTRQGSTWRIFVDGVLLNSITASIIVHNSTEILRLGKRRSVAFDDLPLDGFLDDWRITVGVPVYTVTFTPPSSAHPIPIDDTQEVFENRIYECTVAGTTASIAPIYDEIVGNTTIDGTATFTAREAWMRHGVIDTITSNKQFTLTVAFDETRAIDDYFNGGAIEFESGNNKGKIIEMRDWVSSTRDIDLFLPEPFNVISGDKVRLYPGCDKRSIICIDKFIIPFSKDFTNGNIKNFRGEPFIPGQDELTRTPDAKS